MRYGVPVMKYETYLTDRFHKDDEHAGCHKDYFNITLFPLKSTQRFTENFPEQTVASYKGKAAKRPKGVFFFTGFGGMGTHSSQFPPFLLYKHWGTVGAGYLACGRNFFCF